jgi:hypothetical protein
MPPPPAPEIYEDERPPERPLSPFALKALRVLWPSFVLAGALETMTFAALDPDSLHTWTGEPFGWSRSAVYTVSFFIFWGVIATSGAITQWLQETETP